MHHRVDASPQTVHWGYFDASLKPVLTIESGDRVTITTVSGSADQMPAEKFSIPDALAAIHATTPRELGPHICTGPVAVRGAKPGQVLEVRIEAIELLYDWGYNMIRPGSGGLPEDFQSYRLIHIPLDRERRIARMSWGAEIPLRPFFGIMTVAPSAASGRISSVPPRRHGGNIDNKELTAGSTLYLPIETEGALFSVGDGHGCQGDGEVCLTAIETGLTGTFSLHLRTDLTLDSPLAETPHHMITMAFDPDLDICAAQALRSMIDLICRTVGLSREDAYTLCSLAVDLRVTQIVNGNKGVHAVLDKRYLQPLG